MSDSTMTEVAFSFDLTVEAPCQDVFDLLSDLAEASKIAGAAKVRMTTKPPVGLGTEWVTRGRLRRSHSTVTGYDRPHRILREVGGSPAMVGTIEDLVEPLDGGTRLTRAVNIESNRYTTADLKEGYIRDFSRLKVFLEQAHLVRQDSQDPRIIAETLDRVKGRARQEPHVTSPEHAKTEEDAGVTGWENGETKGSRPPRLLAYLLGSMDIYVTCLYRHGGLALREGIREFIREAGHAFAGPSKRAQLTVPKRGHESEYWEEAVRLFDAGGSHAQQWGEDRCYVLVSAVPPSAFTERRFPLLRIDITSILPSEVRLLVRCLKSLRSRNRLVPIPISKGYGRPLFREDLSRLPEASPTRARETAFDALSLALIVIPTLTIDFLHFNPEVSRRFESVCEETIRSQPWAMSFKKALELRCRLRNEAAALPEEALIRDVWD